MFKATIARSLEANNKHFAEARDQLDQWAEDMELAAKELEDTKRQYLMFGGAAVRLRLSLSSAG